MDIDTAAQVVVHETDGLSVQQIASMAGMRYQTLINKVNPDNDTHKLTLREAVALQQVTGNHAILHTMETLLGDRATEQEPLQALLTSAIKHGDVVKLVNNALEDGHLTASERRDCLKVIAESIKGLQDVQQSLANGELQAVSNH